MRLFVTGTDTGVGKTRVAAGLCAAFAARGLRVAAMKPVASGCVPGPQGLRSEDALALIAAANSAAAYADVNPYAFEPAIAPHLAAARAGTTIDEAILDQAQQRLCRAAGDVLVVEGAGGWLVPLDAHRSLADLAVRWRLDVVVVVAMRLGCLNHALMTFESIVARGLRVAGWVANIVDPDFECLAENIAYLRAAPAPCLGVVPHAPRATAAEVAQALEIDRLAPRAGPQTEARRAAPI